MEENSEVHVDTEVSSTSSAVPDTRQATGIHGNVETVIVVEEVKEEHLSYGTPESSPTKSKDEQGAMVTPTLSPENNQSKKIVISQNEVKKVYLNRHKKPAMSAEVNCTPPGSESDQRAPTKSGLVQKTSTKLEPAQKLPIKLVRMKMTPSKFEHAQKTSLNSEHVQNTPNKLEAEPEKPSLIIEQVPKKLDDVQKMHINSECTKKPDQMPKTPLKSDQVSKMPPQPDQVPRSLSNPDQVSKTPPKSDQVQKSAPQTDQVPKSPPESPPKSDQVPKSPPESPPKSDQVPKLPPKTDQVPKSPSNLDQVPKTPTISEQMNKITSEQVHKKLEQVLETPTNSDVIQNTPTESEQVQKTTSVPADETVKIVGQRPKQATIKSLERQKSADNIIDISDDEVIVNTKRVPESISEKSTRASKQTKELVKEQEQPMKTPGILDLNKSDSHSNKSEKSSIKDKSPVKDKQNINMDPFENAEPGKESSDKVKGVKNDEKREDVVSNTSIDICEQSNDSQLETNSDLSEKDHNKSISRELKSLIKSAKESKIISECTQLTSKMRKSRAAADSNNTSLNTSVEADKIQNVRRSSINSQKSNCSEKSEKASLKRSMRSQNPEFVNKVKQFLNSVTGKSQKGNDEDEIDGNKKKDSGNLSPSPKKKKTESQRPEATEEQSRRLRSDMYCWRCHWAVEQATNEKAHPPLLCTVCPRSFHYKCISGTERNKTMTVKGWICPECMNVLHAESAETQSLAMKKLNHPRLCELLQYAWDRMVDLNGVEPFMNPVDRTAFPDYDKYVVHPMDLSLMKQNLTLLKYGSTEAFLADAQWILHNSIIFNTLQSKLTAAARAVVRSCRAEMGEIEACPECYAAAHARPLTWFTDVCSTPHILLWAKLKGFPYWPAKGMSVNSQGLVDVRFFGAHDRAWVPARDCFLYCQKDPNNFKAKRLDILESMQEASDHIRNISRKYGKFVYPAFKTPFDATKLTEQLKKMIPTFDGEVSALVKEKPANSSPNAIKHKSRSNSKSSKTSMNEGDASESEEAKTTPPQKMADAAEIAREKDDVSTEKNAPMEIDEQSVQNKEKESSRKRRRSALEEAVITIITTSSNEKRKKLDEEKLYNFKTAESTQESRKAENTQESSKTESTQKESKKPEETTISETTKSYNNKNEKTSEKSNNKGEKAVPTTPTIDKEVNKEVLTKKVEKTQVVTSTPVKTTPKVKPTKTSTPKEKEDKITTPKQKPPKPDKSSQIEKDMQNESILQSRKRSKSRNRSLNSSQVEKGAKTVEKKNDKDTVSNDSTKEKVKEPNIPSRDKESEPEKPVEKAIKPSTDGTDSPKPAKDRLQFDDDTSLAVIARETAKTSLTGLPTIISVQSLSASPQSTSTTTKTTTTPKTVEVTVSAHCALNVFTPTSTDNVRNMKEAVNKLQKLRNETDKPLVGRVGVRSFARMTSPPAPPEKEKPNDTVEIEVKAEPIDFDDADRQVEKMDLMRSFHLQPVNPVTTASLRDVRINKVIVAPTVKKGVMKTTEVRVRARKTFPTPRKDANDGRSELNGKNTMVYIPIQPPTTQAPTQRATRPITINGTINTQNVRPQAPASIANSIVNTLSSPLVSVPMATSLAITTPKPAHTIATNSHNNAICVPSVGQMPTMGQICQVPTVGQIPTTVHTVPLLTSVNGQWTFSLQPMMSVGSDGTASPPVVNGLSERNAPFIPVTPANPLALLPSTQILPSNKNTSNNNNSSTSNNGESTPVEMPRLQQRPPLANPFDPSAPVSTVPVPSTAGPLTTKLSQNAVKLADFFRTLLEDSLEKIDDPLSQVTTLKTQLEQAKWKHKQEISELKHTHELLTTEMRVAFEKDKTRAISEMRRVAQVELEAAVKAAKTKQWCANCSQEAQFYCCWNTAYCDYSCQRSHWSQHFAVCTQPRNAENNTNENGNSVDKRLQSTSENLPRNAAPPLTAGTKLAPTRVYSQDAHQQKTSIIVSMVEDPSGNQMVKCVGTYKPPGQQQVSPLILNKHLMGNDENAAKKVMTSGGYLIVGAGNNTPLATNRRNHPVQYTYNT